MQLVRTIGSNSRFQLLVTELDKFTAKIDGEEFHFYAQFNKSLALKYVVLAIENDVVLGCGAFKFLDDIKIEIKRMFVVDEARGKRVGETILNELEIWAKELNAKEAVLETGKEFTSAIKLYERCGYNPIPRYGQYIDASNSRCYAKSI